MRAYDVGGRSRDREAAVRSAGSTSGAPFLSYLGESEKADGAYGGPRQRWESQKLGLGMETKTRELLARLRVVSLKR